MPLAEPQCVFSIGLWRTTRRQPCAVLQIVLGRGESRTQGKHLIFGTVAVFLPETPGRDLGYAVRLALGKGKGLTEQGRAVFPPYPVDAERDLVLEAFQNCLALPEIHGVEVALDIEDGNRLFDYR